MSNYTPRLLTLILLLTAGMCAQAQTITNIAGNATGGYSGDKGSAVAAQLHWPQGVALDRAGNLYIADALNNRIRKVAPSGIITSVAGTGFMAGTGSGAYTGDGGPATAADLFNPGGVALDTLGNLYIADTKNNCVRKVDYVSGIITTIAGTGAPSYGGDNGPAVAAKLNQPTRVTTDTLGNLYIADPMNNRIRKVDGTGKITTVAGTGAPSYTGDGGQATDATLMNPVDVVSDKAGNLYIADESNNCVRMVTTTGAISTIAGTGIPALAGDGDLAVIARLYNPAGVALDDSGNVYISDQGNARIRAVNKLTGIITNVVGADTAGYSGNGGPATAARISFPQGLTVNHKGSIYIADMENNVIRFVGAVKEGVSNVQNNFASISIVPNPGTGAFVLQVSSVLNEQATVTVTNVAGEKIYTSGIYTNKATALTLSAPAGMYLVAVSSAHGVCSSQLIIK